jgi:hypothetical protein
MYAQMLWFSTVLRAVNVGWQPLPEGGMEYIIQLDPQTIEALKAGAPIQSDIPPNAGDVRSYKIIFGTEKLPQIDALSKPAEFPKSFSADPNRKPLTANQAALIEPVDKTLSTQTASLQDASAKNAEQEKPWMPLILVSLGLFASLGGNAYLAWLFADIRRRYKKLSTPK